MSPGFARFVCLGVVGLIWLAACSDDDGAESTVASPETVATDDPAPTNSGTVPTTDDIGLQRLYSG
ncbi:MAG TPA: hypothetical protein VK860_12330, partial [Ilumatobacteraceae bacterium]|nr:hypothetical protein [Ilumatobacteraceae bacterium]